MGDIKRNTISDQGWANLAASSERIIRTRLDLIRASGMSVADIRAKTVEGGYQLILIDYLQLIQATGENRTAQVTNISIGLHTLAQSLGVTVVALSQLARQNPQSGNLGMASLRESGQIEQDADVVMILTMDGDSKTRRILSIEKNKEGTCPAIRLDFEGRYQTFSKAHATGDVVDKYVHEGKKARRQNRKGEQMSVLPDDTPVPFEEGSNGK
jgi:replicative DNA helicase